MIAKGCAAANLLISFPFVLSALGPAQYGAWATLVSLVTFAGFLDFGFGNGAMNLSAAAHARGAPAEVCEVLRESRHVPWVIAAVLGVIALAVLPVVQWQHLLGLPAAMSVESRTAVAAVLFSVLFSIVLAVPLNLPNRVQLGLARGDRAFRWPAVGQVLSVVLVVALAKAGAPLAALTAAAVATPLLASLANTWDLLGDRSINAPAAASRRERRVVRAQICSEGLLFFGLQLSAALRFSADLPLISALQGPTEAGIYAVVQRLFSLIPLGLSLVWAPLWPIYRQALASGHRQWAMRTLWRSLSAALAFSIVGAGILSIGFDQFVAGWLPLPVAASGLLVGGFAVWCVLAAGGTAMATFLNAASVLRYQPLTACVFAVLCFSGKLWVIAKFGTLWTPWVSVATYLVASVAPRLLFGPRILAGVMAKKYCVLAHCHEPRQNSVPRSPWQPALPAPCASGGNAGPNATRRPVAEQLARRVVDNTSHPRTQRPCPRHARQPQAPSAGLRLARLLGPERQAIGKAALQLMAKRRPLVLITRARAIG